jgi:Tubulin/FtsZ family, GTPase domain
VVAVRETNERREYDRTGPIARTDEVDAGLWEPHVRLGHDVRFLLVAVGGGGVRIGREIARRHLRYLETVAINCDPRVAAAEEFDRRICLGSDDGPSLGIPTSAAAAGQLARAAEPALDRIFEGATFVTVVASLGGGSGTGILPAVLESASRSAEVLSVFVVKPFAIEAERRAVADRAIGGLHFLDSFVEKHQRRQATLTVLDNEELARREPRLALRQVPSRWAERIAEHIDASMLGPVEALLEAQRLSQVPFEDTYSRVPPPSSSSIGPVVPEDFPPLYPQMSPDGAGSAPDVELTFEVIAGPRGPEAS